MQLEKVTHGFLNSPVLKQKRLSLDKYCAITNSDSVIIMKKKNNNFT